MVRLSATGAFAFHDIVPDFRARYARETPSDAGEVPRYWSNVKDRGNRITELIDDPEQDGYGIGVIRVNGSSP